jgi:transposase
MSIRSLHLKVERRETIARSVIEEGLSTAVAARIFRVSPDTVKRWVERFRQKGIAGLRTRYRRYPLKTPPEKIALIKALREKRELPIAQISAETDVKGPTVANLLRRLRLTKSRKQRLKEGWWMPQERAHLARILDWLSVDQKAAIIEEVRTGESYTVIAERWLASSTNIAKIAREIGIHRNRSPIRNLLTPEQQLSVLDAVQRGLTAEEIASQYDLGSGAVSRFARFSGVKRPPNKRDVMRSMPRDMVDMILGQCRFSRASYEEIGKPFGLNRQDVNWLALQHGIRRTLSRR